METEIIKLDSLQPDLKKISKAAEELYLGALVGIPTETVYGIACRVKDDSLARLDALKNRSVDKFYTLHIGRKDDVEKFVPDIGLKAQKLIENLWPGPLTIVFELSDEEAEKQKNSLDAETFRNLYKNNSIGIRCPSNKIASLLLQAAKCSIVAPSANFGGKKPATDAEAVLEHFSGRIEILLDGGFCEYKQSSTVVKVGKLDLEILREGVFKKDELEALSAIKFLFVCTGNTCRSPMAEGIFGKYWSKKLNCDVDLLEKKGYKILSAGTMGIKNLSATPEAINACQARGVDLKAHKSRALTQQLVDESDYIFVMGQEHFRRVLDLAPQAKDKCRLLAGNREIADPIGQSQSVYDNCADQIEKAIKKIVGGFKI